MKKLKTIAAICALCSMMLTTAAFAVENDERNVTSLVKVGSEITPYSTYYKKGDLNFWTSNASLKVEAITTAYQTVSHIYHDVTVYVNGNWYSSERYENWNKKSLDTSFNVPASSGDYIDVYVDHYTEHNGLTEVEHSRKAVNF